jgi:aspartate aminotransferase-like enzyme
MSYKLFIPGPVNISEKTYKALTTPLFGHRSQDFVQLYQSIQPSLQKLFYTKDPVFISTSSAWGVMEGSIRNLTKKKVLNCMCGAFSDKWEDVSQRCGKQAKGLQFEWGTPVAPQAVQNELNTGEYDTITMVHNETSTGVMNPLDEIMAVVRQYPEVISIVDTVSSFSVLPIEKDKLGIDVMITGSQKALALPPGLALFSVSERALKRSSTLKDRGYYFDFLEFQKNHEKGMTPSTPNIPHIFALRSKLEDIFAEGLENRYARHEKLNNLVHAWVHKNQFELLPQKPFASKSLSCIKNTHQIDIIQLNQQLKQRYNCVIDCGYGKLKEKTFRISNMGDETEQTINALLHNLDTLLKEIPR